MRADRRLYLDLSRSKLVPESEAAWLLAGQGQEIPLEDVKRLGLEVWSDGRVMQGPEPEPEVKHDPVWVPVESAGVVESEPFEGRRPRRRRKD